MITTKKIKKNLYKIEMTGSIPIYLEIGKEFIRIVQPILNDRKKFEENEYFTKGFPQEIVIDRKNLKEIWNTLGKILITQNLK